MNECMNPPSPAPRCAAHRPATAHPRVARTVLLGSRVRNGVLTISDDNAGRVGFANVDCSRVARDWEASQAQNASNTA